MSETRRDSLLLTVGVLGLFLVLWVPELLPSLGGRSQMVSQAILGLLCSSLLFAVLWRHIRIPRGDAGKNFERATLFSWWVGFSVVGLVAVFLSPWIGNLAKLGLYQILFLALVMVVVRACPWWLALAVLCPVTCGLVVSVGEPLAYGLVASVALGSFVFAARTLRRVVGSWWAALAVALALALTSSSFLSGLMFWLLMGVLVASRMVPCLSECGLYRRLRLPV